MEIINSLDDIGRLPLPNHVGHMFRSFGDKGAVFVFSCYMYEGRPIEIIYPRYVDMEIYKKFLNRLGITELQFNNIVEDMEKTLCEQLRDNPQLFYESHKLLGDIITLGKDTDDIMEALDYRDCDLYNLEIPLK